jgi:hypothetical protein
MSSGHGGRELDRWQPSLRHAWCVDAKRVGGEVHDADIVTIDKCALRWWGLELVEQLMQPGGLSHAVGNGTILGLSAGAGDDNLPLGRPGNQVVPQEHHIA